LIGRYGGRLHLWRGDPSAADRTGTFPRASIDALARAGVLGAASATDVGGAGGGLAAGEWTPAAIARAVEELQHAMDDGRRQRLARLGFPPDEAAELSALHTRNVMW